MDEEARMQRPDDPAIDVEESLLEGIRKGSTTSWRDFVTRYEGLVAATVIGMVGRGPDAEDIGQEVFIQFFKHVHSFRGDAKVSTYLTRSAINLSLNAIKRRSRMRRWYAGPPEETLSSPAPRPDAQVEMAEFSQRVAEAIRTLKPEYRSVVVLRLVQDFSTAETAAVLDIPKGTVMSRLSRGQTQLRALLSVFSGHQDG